MQEVLIFSGTSEGRRLAGQLIENEIAVTVCVATDYGQEVMEQEEENPLLKVHRGRLDLPQMEKLIGSRSWSAVVDATHPFAQQVTKNIAQACANQGCKLLRLLRQKEEKMDSEEGRQQENQTGASHIPQAKIIYVDSVEEAADYLNQTQGNIFFTTGSKELPKYLSIIEDISRVYVRILPDSTQLEQCRSLGLKGKQIICMQGPFSEALNTAMLQDIRASVLVTKETSHAGGFSEKLRAAAQTGAEAVVIRRPCEHGYSMKQILEKLGVKCATERRVTLAGMGMGSLSNMTREVYKACQNADLIIGASRMLETVKSMGKPAKSLYRSEEIVEYVVNHPQYREILILLSGDVGFYSGAKRILEAFSEINERQESIEHETLLYEDKSREYQVSFDTGKRKDDPTYQLRLLCGVPSVVYFASRLGISWEDLQLLSLHGRQQNLIGALQNCGNVFALMDGAEGIRKLSRELLDYGFSEIEMNVGCQLSYPQEKILRGTPEQFLDYDDEGVAVVILRSEQASTRIVTHGIPDAEFVRGEVPMTKEEVRSISLAKLALTQDAIVYDIGAGTGSVAIECARQAVYGKVYAIERNSQALHLIRENKLKHRVANLELIEGEAPQVLKELPAPTHVFIGGSGGKLREIVELIWRKNPSVRLVVNVVSLETLREIMELMEDKLFAQKEIVQVSVAKAKTLGQHHLMIGQNPVYVITLQK